jgi:uncharacterized membrane protein YkoI
VRRIARNLVVAAASGLLVAAAAAGADQGHERALEALRRREILPLRAILDAAERDFLGRVVEVELEGGPPDAWIYEIEIVAPEGSILRLTYDARTGQLIRATGRGLERARRPR